MDLYFAGDAFRVFGVLYVAFSDLAFGISLSAEYGGHIHQNLETASDMDLFLAGMAGRRNAMCEQLGVLQERFSSAQDQIACINSFPDGGINIYILESFFYMDSVITAMVPKLSKFLLDSGAFTFFTSGKRINWDEYIEKYARFIVEHNIQQFFELDIDKLVGYDKVLEYRRRLEHLAGRRCIPVWHKSRGKNAFLEMCDEYDYVAIGGIVSKEIKPPDFKLFPWFINQAHKRGAKIHGLGFTYLKELEQYHFDSVDSSSWTSGNRFGKAYRFNGRTLDAVKKKAGQRAPDSRALAVHNFNEWVKFQRYAKRHL